ncbi:MAG: hypothetical protein K2P81_03485 [Bacteriovoracaceae bacterium]|nr:hypothetical protein [Bacteriovoracaceae bacterium]
MKRSELQNNLAMTIALISAAMLFVTLFMGYAVYRSSAEAWPPVGMAHVSLTLPFLSTIFIAVSSWFCFQVKNLVAINDLKRANRNLNLTMLMGVGFMISQSFLWLQLKESGIYVTSGIFASVMYGFTWIHAVHVIGGLLALVYLKIVLRPKTNELLQKTINVERFWHFLGIVWFAMFMGMFVF